MKGLRIRIAMALVGPACLLAAVATPVTVAQAAVPSAVDSYGGNAFAAAVHVIVGSNNDPNFSQGAIGNRYPLTQVSQDVAPASQATSSLNDIGPLVQTVAGTDCGAPPPWPLPPPIPNPNFARYCFETVRENAPYAHAQYPNPPGVADQSVNGPGGAGLFGLPPVPPSVTSAVGTATSHADQLAAHADGAYNGAAPVPGQAAISNAIAHSDTALGADGTLTVTTHSHVASACFGGCGVSNYLMVTNLDVVTSVVAVAGKATPTATVTPGQVLYCATPSTCQPVQLDNTGVTVGLPNIPVQQSPLPALGGLQQVPAPGLGGSGQSPFFHVRTVAPNAQNKDAVGSVDAAGLDIAVTQPGNPDHGVPDSTVEYVLGEGHADGFSIASVPFADLSTSSAGFGGGVPYTTGGFNGASGTPGSSQTTIRQRSPAYVLAGALRPPFAVLFFGWEASVLGAAASLVWARRRPRLEEEVG